MYLTEAARLVSRGATVLQAAPEVRKGEERTGVGSGTFTIIFEGGSTFHGRARPRGHVTPHGQREVLWQSFPEKANMKLPFLLED